MRACALGVLQVELGLPNSRLCSLPLGKDLLSSLVLDLRRNDSHGGERRSGRSVAGMGQLHVEVGLRSGHLLQEAVVKDVPGKRSYEFGVLVHLPQLLSNRFPQS